MRRISALLVCASAASVAGAQQAPIPAVRPLGAVTAKSSTQLGNVFNLRHLPNGNVLVNDVAGRKVVMLDASLNETSVVADSTGATANAYSGRIGNLLAYRGDSTLFIDPTSMSMLVIDPSGKVGRVMSVPRSQDAAALGGPQAANAGFDAKGRLVYRGAFRFGGGPQVQQRTPGAAGGPAFVPPQLPESASIVRVDLASRSVDTVGFIKLPKINLNIQQDDKGNMSMTSEVNPLPVVDEWAVLSDGSVAIVRGRDFHVDFVNADGSVTSAAKIPFDWRRLTDEDKVAFMDSVKAQRARLVAAGQGVAGATGAQVVTSSTTTTAGAATTEQRAQASAQAAGATPGGFNINIQMGGPGQGGRGGPGGFTPQEPKFVAPSELPDYQPPFFAGTVRADMDGNLWIRTIPTRAIPGGTVYSVINRQGELVDRVQAPEGRTIVGFGKGGVVYMTSRGPNGLVLEKASAK